MCFYYQAASFGTGVTVKAETVTAGYGRGANPLQAQEY